MIEPDVAVGLNDDRVVVRRHLQRPAPADALPPPDRHPAPPRRADGRGMILVRQHGESGPPALLGEWLELRGIPYHVSDSRDNGHVDPRDYEAVASLGCRFSPTDADVPQVKSEIELITQGRRARRPRARPVLRRPGARARARRHDRPAPTPEFGWRAIETDEPDSIPAGPWLLWHYQRFTTPPGATEVARTKDATQAFRHGPHLGLQFHPESTTDIVAGWASKDREKLASIGITNGPELIEAPDERKEAAQAGGLPPVRRLQRRERMIEERAADGTPAGAQRPVRDERPGHLQRPARRSRAARTSRSASSTAWPTTASRSARRSWAPTCATRRSSAASRATRTCVAKPDLSTLTLLPWEPGVACCIADLHPVERHRAAAGRPARRRARAVAGFEELGYSPIVGPELEFFLCTARRERRPAPLRRQPEHGLHGRPAGRSEGRRARDHRGAQPARHAHVRLQPRVHELAVRDQPAPRARADRRRPRVPPQERGQGRRRDPRADRHLHGQAVQRPGRLGLPLPLLARPRGRQRLRRPSTTRTASAPSCGTSPPASSRMPTR